MCDGHAAALQQFSQQTHCRLSRRQMFEDQSVSVCLAVCPYWHFSAGYGVARLMVTFAIKMAVKFCTHVGIAISPQELSSMFFPGVFLRRSCEVWPFLQDSEARNYRSNNQKLEPGYRSRYSEKVTSWCSGIPTPVGAKTFYFLQNVQTVAGAHPTFSGYRRSFPGVKWPGREVDHSFFFLFGATAPRRGPGPPHSRDF